MPLPKKQTQFLSFRTWTECVPGIRRKGAPWFLCRASLSLSSPIHKFSIFSTVSGADSTYFAYIINYFTSSAFFASDISQSPLCRQEATYLNDLVRTEHSFNKKRAYHFLCKDARSTKRSPKFFLCLSNSNRSAPISCSILRSKCSLHWFSIRSKAPGQSIAQRRKKEIMAESSEGTCLSVHTVLLHPCHCRCHESTIKTDRAREPFDYIT